MADYVEELLHDLLASNSKSATDSASSQGSYYPSHECFMVDIIDDPHREATPEGHVTSANNGASHGGNETPPHPTGGCGSTAGVEVTPHPRMNQLRERQQELETT
jgi:hypothetical protein